jgi:DDE_Tnp_1-associated/Pyridine nucleotide-disulphide oxidoreductase
VPATPSSSIPAALTHLTHADPRQLRGADAPHLLAYLAAVPDPRAARGRRHRLVAILALAAAAVLAGARSIAAIAEWAADAPQPIRAALGAHRDAPGHFAVPAEATSRQTLSRLDPDALAGAVGAWLADRDRALVPAGAGGRRASDLAGRLGCTMLPDGCVEVDEFARTSVPGVYAAGDMAHRASLPMPFAAVSWASASGTLAGAMLDQDLIATDFKLQALQSPPSSPAVPAGQDGAELTTADATS